GVVDVKIYLDNSLIETSSMSATSPVSFTYHWNSTQTTNGRHSLHATATNSLGVVGSSAIVDITVNNVPPTVSLTAPSSISGLGSLEVTASDTSGMVGVNIYLDGNLIQSYAMEPTSSVSLTYQWDSSQVANGTHALQATATDSLGAIGSSALVNV